MCPGRNGQPGIVARTWRGRTPLDDSGACCLRVLEQAIQRLRRTPGNQQAWLLRSNQGRFCEFLVVSLWQAPSGAGLDLGPGVRHCPGCRVEILQDGTYDHITAGQETDAASRLELPAHGTAALRFDARRWRGPGGRGWSARLRAACSSFRFWLRLGVTRRTQDQ